MFIPPKSSYIKLSKDYEDKFNNYLITFKKEDLLLFDSSLKSYISNNDKNLTLTLFEDRYLLLISILISKNKINKIDDVFSFYIPPLNKLLFISLRNKEEKDIINFFKIYINNKKEINKDIDIDKIIKYYSWECKSLKNVLN